MEKCFRPSGVHRFADRLPCPFLKSCRKKKSAQVFVQRLTFRHNDAENQFTAHHRRVVFAKENISDRIDCFFFTPVDLGRQDSRIGEMLVAGMVVKLRSDIAGQNIRQISAV